MYSELKPSQRAAVVGVIDPDAYAAGTYTTGWVAAADWYSFLAIVTAGDLGASATLDAKMRQATSAAGAGAKDVTGYAITQLTQAGTDSNKQALINIKSEALYINGGFTHVQLSMTIGTAASDAGAVLLGFDPRYGPANRVDADSVDEIVG